MSRSGYSILLIDDEADIREGLSELLDEAGYQTTCACNGREALSLLRSAQALPDVILLDMMMPLMDGLSFRWEQLADPALATIPVVILSASGHCHASAVELRTEGCIQKPCHPADVLELVAKVCQAQR